VFRQPGLYPVYTPAVHADYAPENLTSEAGMTSIPRRCAKGHAMDPHWESCPYCEAEGESQSRVGRMTTRSDPQTSKPRAAPVGQMSNSRVFISSTSVDLQEYRQAVLKAIQSLGGYGDDMIFWSADERSGAALSLDRVRQSDVLVLILAHRYGHVPEGSAYSVTEMEYRAARTAGIPVLAFVLDEDVPWPPKFIEHERAIEMANFKALVGEEVTWRLFHSPDELMALVTHALVSLATRSASQRPRSGRSFRGSARLVSQASLLRWTPDAVVHVGLAEDGLPLVLEVSRSQDVGSLLEEITNKVVRPGAEPPEAMFKTFQQSLEQYSRQAWAQERVFAVAGRDGVSRDMYVTSSTLATLFDPLFANILDPQYTQGIKRKDQGRRVERTVKRTVIGGFGPQGIAADESPAKDGIEKTLQSVGGQNRFLGISLDEGSVVTPRVWTNVRRCSRPRHGRRSLL
jgi:hypothetical protein